MPAPDHAPDPGPPYTAHWLAEHVGGRLVGPPDLKLQGVAEIDRAQPGDLTFIGQTAYVRRWPHSQASAALLPDQLEPELDPGPQRALIRVPDVDLAMARAIALFAPPLPQPEAGIHPTAVIDPSARIADDVRIGPYCVIGPQVHIGPGTILHANVTILDHARIGAQCTLWPGVVIRERCEIGDRCILHLNVCIGADGFGYRPDPETAQLVKIPQIGTVRIGSDVELGAGTCVDRAKFDATTIGDNTKIDNLVQIGHNCRIGRSVVIAGHTGVAGSVTIGDGAMLGGMVALRDHLRIGSRARITGGAQVMHDVPDGQTWGGSPARPFREAAAQLQALKRLPGLVKQFRRG